MTTPVQYDGLRYDTRGRIIGADPIDRFTAFVHLTDDCWLWTGKINPNGYGAFAVDGKWRYAHRVSLELLVETPPADLQVDHLCQVKRCVNPDHLELVPAITNMHRQARVGAQVAQTHCTRGHELTAENTYMWRGERKCRACRRQRESARRAVRRSA